MIFSMEHKHAEQQTERKSVSLISFGWSVVESHLGCRQVLWITRCLFPPRPERFPCPGEKDTKLLVQRRQSEKGWAKFPVTILGSVGKMQRSLDFSPMKIIIDNKLPKCESWEVLGASFRLTSLVHRKYVEKTASSWFLKVLCFFFHFSNLE